MWCSWPRLMKCRWNWLLALLEVGLRVVDLSGAFRLREREIHRRWYGDEHQAVELLRTAVYGLPEFYRERVRGAKFVSNPGCYPTAANLALGPLMRGGLVDRAAPIICDAKSGVSGAGRKASLKTSFCEAGDNFNVYSAFSHRHVPEVLQNCDLAESEFHFVAQLLPTSRGILETIYLRLREGKGTEDLLAAYDAAYREEPFVRLYDPGQYPDLHAVQHTNFCDIGFQVAAESRVLMVVAVIDNLVKGAAGQAVQNMNLMFGFDETEGLL
ncbi:MAG: N-acetyl-gamma-glutamyl-phosphate reductase [Bryobacterales bacterium]|nr:N-acetyl-gamma-glutamyl-phosphate reductase [Bryobacterales bacterium]